MDELETLADGIDENDASILLEAQPVTAVVTTNLDRFRIPAASPWLTADHFAGCPRAKLRFDQPVYNQAPVAQGIERRFPKPCVGCSNHPGSARVGRAHVLWLARRNALAQQMLINFSLGFDTVSDQLGWTGDPSLASGGHTVTMTTRRSVAR